MEADGLPPPGSPGADGRVAARSWAGSRGQARLVPAPAGALQLHLVAGMESLTSKEADAAARETAREFSSGGGGS